MNIEPLAADAQRHIGRYHLLATLGPTVVYPAFLAVGPDNGVFVVRTAPEFLRTEPAFRIGLRHGAVAATRLAGSHVTPVFDLDADAEVPWVAAPFVAGVGLNEAVTAHGPLAEQAVRTLAAALADALCTIHAAGLVHRALRPDTVTLTGDGLRLTDTGLPSVADFAEAARRPDAIAGPPDFLSPEQTMAAELTPASDVFAFGSVLAFAASGASPFAAASVPYTLFNIAQHEPDLSRVPESLRPLIAACLRKEPRARPTAAQLREYLAPQAAPTPWPPAVLDTIGRREQQVAGLLAALPADRETPARKPAAVLTDFARAGRRRVEMLSKRARVASAIGLVVLLVAASGGYFVLREDPPAGPLTALSLDQARRIDACAWLKSALGESIPLQAGPVPTAAWKLAPTSDWGCFGSANRHSIRLTLGEHLEYMTPHRTLVDGVPVIYGSSAACTRAIANAGAERRTGIVLSLSLPYDRSEKCDPAIDGVAAVLARTLAAAPANPDAESSLVRLDPCALLDRDSVDAMIGPLPPQPTIAGAHTCAWSGRMELQLTMSRGEVDDSAATTVDGLDLYPDKPSSDRASCEMSYRFRETEPAEAELVAVELSGAAGARDEYCRMAERVLVSAVAQLPGR
ncbi:serine/threonine protein kinase [Nocardia lijiangensis]|uniref:serine/threonine protein kinase n=1 Tax=Nocardia lijiangensis TaxID=299618 RepID=UPI000833452B|nr:protein kinase [Nocardia lijiangensis]